MCNEPKCNWWRHLLGQCNHYKKVGDLQYKIMSTRSMTNRELKRFNRQLNLIIKDENIKVTLTNIRKVAENDI